MIRKSYSAQFKALPDEGGQKGRFEAIVAVFGNVDLVGDRVVKGAFDANLKEWKKSGDPIPAIWSHSWGDPFAHIGSFDPELAEETDQGLKLIGTIDLDNEFAAQVYRLLKERRVREMSFAYDIRKERKAKDGANELVILDLIEAGPTLKGANQETELLGVKASLEEAAGKQIYEPLSGSAEERAKEVRAAVEAWGNATYGAYDEDNRVWVMVAATFPDRVIVSVEKSGEDTEYFELEYTVGDDGEVTLGDATPVEVSVTVTAKGETKPTREKTAELPTSLDVDALAGALTGAQDALAEVITQLKEVATEEPAAEQEEPVVDEPAPEPEPASEPASEHVERDSLTALIEDQLEELSPNTSDLEEAKAKLEEAAKL